MKKSLRELAIDAIEHMKETKASENDLEEAAIKFILKRNEDGNIVLIPYAEIPANEAWLLSSKLATSKLKQGLKEATAGRFSERGSFVKYIQDNDE